MSIRLRMHLMAATLFGLVIYGVAVPRTTAFSSILASPAEEVSPAAREVPIDLYGNEVSQAVGRYQVDLLGGWYEEHSPDTVVPTLLPPQG